jgi:hypothetical protein
MSFGTTEGSTTCATYSTRNVTRLRGLLEEVQAGETMDRAPSILKRPPGRLLREPRPLCGPDGIPTGAHSPVPSVIHGRHALMAKTTRSGSWLKGQRRLSVALDVRRPMVIAGDTIIGFAARRRTQAVRDQLIRYEIADGPEVRTVPAVLSERPTSVRQSVFGAGLSCAGSVESVCESAARSRSFSSLSLLVSG